jgi:hypothetical protein
MFFPPKEDGSDNYKISVQDRLDKFREKAVPLVAKVCRQAVKEAGMGE